MDQLLGDFLFLIKKKRCGMRDNNLAIVAPLHGILSAPMELGAWKVAKTIQANVFFVPDERPFTDEAQVGKKQVEQAIPYVLQNRHSCFR